MRVLASSVHSACVSQEEEDDDDYDEDEDGAPRAGNDDGIYSDVSLQRRGPRHLRFTVVVTMVMW